MPSARIQTAGWRKACVRETLPVAAASARSRSRVCSSQSPSAGVSQLAPETRTYVPRVLELHGRLKEEFAKGIDPQLEPMQSNREGKTLAGPPAAASPASGAGQARKRTR